MIGVGVHVSVYVFGGPKNFERTSAIDSPFQTFSVGLLVEFIATTAFSRKASKLRVFLFNAHLALFVQRMTQLQSLSSIGMYRHLVKLTLELASE